MCGPAWRVNSRADGNDLLLDVTLAAAGPAIGRFSAAHSITSVDAWVAALFLMALAEVVTRLAVLWLRSSRLPSVDAPAPARATVRA